MQSRAFEFRLGKRKCWAQGHPLKRPCVTLVLHHEGEVIDVSVNLMPAEARAMATALEAAATHAENVIADTGLGEGEVDR